VVEPVDPFQSGKLHGFEVSPRCAPMDDLGLVKTVDRFSESVVIGVTNTSDRRLDARFRQPFGIANGHILRSAVGMVNKPATVDGLPIMKRLVEGIENETRMGSPACSPTDDAASEGIDHERDVNEALLSGHIREIRKPQHVRCRSKEVPVHPVERAWGGLVADRRADRFAANDALQSHCPHKPSDSAAGDVVTLPEQLSLDLAHAIDLEVLVEHPAYLDLHGNVASGTDRQTVHVRALGDDLIIGRRGNRQQSADRLDPEHRAVGIDEGNHRFSGRSSSAWAKYADALRKISLA